MFLFSICLYLYRRFFLSMVSRVVCCCGCFFSRLARVMFPDSYARLSFYMLRMTMAFSGVEIRHNLLSAVGCRSPSSRRRTMAKTRRLQAGE